MIVNDNKSSPKNQGMKSPSKENSFRARFAPLPRTFEGEEYYGAADVAKIIGVTKRTVLAWNSTTLNGCLLFTADKRTHDNTFLYKIERVEQLASVYHPKWSRGGYEPSPTTSDPEPFHTHFTPTPPTKEVQTEPVKEVPNEHKTRGKKQFKKIADATIEAINHLSPDELETHGIIQSARVSGYVCPLCSSGDGSNGTGMTQNPKIESHRKPYFVALLWLRKIFQSFAVVRSSLQFRNPS